MLIFFFSCQNVTSKRTKKLPERNNPESGFNTTGCMYMVSIIGVGPCSLCPLFTKEVKYEQGMHKWWSHFHQVSHQYGTPGPHSTIIWSVHLFQFSKTGFGSCGLKHYWKLISIIWHPPNLFIAFKDCLHSV